MHLFCPLSLGRLHSHGTSVLGKFGSPSPKQLNVQRELISTPEICRSIERCSQTLLQRKLGNLVTITAGLVLNWCVIALVWRRTVS